MAAKPLWIWIGIVAALLAAGCAGNKQQMAPANYARDLTTGMEFVLAPAGCFPMGDLWESGSKSEGPVHEVCLDAFYMGKYEVTQGQWKAVMGENPAYFQKGDDHPVEQVSIDDAREFIERLNRKSGRGYRLPTEAEWEYACRSGGKREPFCGSDQPSEVAWFDRTGGGSTQPVGQKRPNGLGLFDMSGNVWEFSSDLYGEDYYATSPRNNPQGPVEGTYSVKRGGSWSINPRFLRSTVRGRTDFDTRHYSTGFRIAFPAVP
ncbi:MAG: hypothetical protein C0617_04470 [Desulfuromonas sp.]|uniref:formylglycine-generating enzyme family protein n=1 Tax=Desulfuromonas sp. TaxID=892 RepID=UPI000CC7B4A9|nr:formylglycine-generating enzyme family protein [Desulfuromonas sp.]PLX85332.1 MAG: hypothetical protein C0617_04470 [Desulfuromonas sp.]